MSCQLRCILLLFEICPSFQSLLAGLSGIQGLEIASDEASPLVFLRLKKSTGSLKGDLQVLEDIAHRVSGCSEACQVNSHSSLVVLAVVLIK